jgi:hypothetical protein
MPDWIAVVIGIVLGVGAGCAFGRMLYSWYYRKGISP